jgi:hypothetical protein
MTTRRWVYINKEFSFFFPCSKPRRPKLPLGKAKKQKTKKKKKKKKSQPKTDNLKF